MYHYKKCLRQPIKAPHDRKGFFWETHVKGRDTKQTTYIERREKMDQAIYVGSVFLGGLLSFFSPCILPVLPVYIGILSDEEKKGKIITLGGVQIQVIKVIKTILFVLGISAAFLLLGFGAGFLGQLFQGKYFYPVIGVL